MDNLHKAIAAVIVVVLVLVWYFFYYTVFRATVTNIDTSNGCILTISTPIPQRFMSKPMATKSYPVVLNTGDMTYYGNTASNFNTSGGSSTFEITGNNLSGAQCVTGAKVKITYNSVFSNH